MHAWPVCCDLIFHW